MAIKLHGSALSGCNQRVVTVLREKGVPYEQITLDFAKGEHKAPDHLKIHPFGRMPVLEDDGFFVYESRAIAKYIAQKYAKQGAKLMPDTSDLKAYALFEQAYSVEESYFGEPTSGILFEKVLKGLKGMGATDDAAVAKHAAILDETLAVYDGILARQAYLAGDEITLADLSHLPGGTMVRDLGFKDLFDKYPNVKKWWDGLEARESWKKIDA